MNTILCAGKRGYGNKKKVEMTTAGFEPAHTNILRLNVAP